MEEYYKKFLLRSMITFLLIAIISFVGFGTTASVVFFIGVIYSLQPLDNVREQTGDWKPVAIGSGLYFTIIAISIIIYWVQIGFFEQVL